MKFSSTSASTGPSFTEMQREWQEVDEHCYWQPMKTAKKDRHLLGMGAPQAGSSDRIVVEMWFDGAQWRYQCSPGMNARFFPAAWARVPVEL